MRTEVSFDGEAHRLPKIRSGLPCHGAWIPVRQRACWTGLRKRNVRPATCDVSRSTRPAASRWPRVHRLSARRLKPPRKPCSVCSTTRQVCPSTMPFHSVVAIKGVAQLPPDLLALGLRCFSDEAGMVPPRSTRTSRPSPRRRRSSSRGRPACIRQGCSWSAPGHRRRGERPGGLRKFFAIQPGVQSHGRPRSGRGSLPHSPGLRGARSLAARGVCRRTLRAIHIFATDALLVSLGSTGFIDGYPSVDGSARCHSPRG